MHLDGSRTHARNMAWCVSLSLFIARGTSGAEPLPSPLKGSKDRFLERAETREAGPETLTWALRPTTFRSAPNRQPLGGRLMAERTSECKCPIHTLLSVRDKPEQD